MVGDRWEAPALDAALHLLDRQVVDVDGMAVCKVDDLELALPDGEAPSVGRLLAGPAALVPRLSNRTGHWLRRRWVSLGVQYAHRDVPLAVDLALVRHLGSAVELRVAREGLLDRQPPAPPGVTHRRMGELLGMRVRSAHPRLRGKVLDVRLRPERDRLVVTHLVVGPGRPGALLGYERSDFDGPWLVGTVVEHLHRHVRLAPWDDVLDIDWDEGVVTVGEDAGVRPVRFD